jgi:phosphohistidine phosphatase SixA
MSRPDRALSNRRMIVARIAGGLLTMILATFVAVPRTDGQTPMADGTPEVLAFRLVAHVGPEERGALATTSNTPAAGEALAGPELVAALREGGYVIYFRHARTDSAQTDSDLSNLANCATQRNLTEEGRVEARLIGEAIGDLAIPVGEVLSSELCRARETAELAFGRATPTPDLSSYDTAGTETEVRERIEALRHLLAMPPAPGTNTVLVGHQFNIGDVTDISLAEGEAAVFLPLGTAEGPATPVAMP